jgi:DNA invertase Pin-like site-specific DNA recombinase
MISASARSIWSRSLTASASTHPPASLHARILASVGEYETEVRAERVRADQAAARAKGKTWGGSKPGRFFKVTPEQIDAIRKTVDEGQKISRVVRIAGLSPPNGVSRVRLGEPRG